MHRSSQLPLLTHLRAATSASLRDDALAGALTAVLLIPQALAYATLAGLPAVHGLYASIVPPLLYALLGTSRSLAIGPFAVTSIMTATALAAFAQGDPRLWQQGALILALEGGIVLVALGLLRLGALVNFISQPVLSGFTSAAALVIIASQIGPLLGLDVPRGTLIAQLGGVASHLQELNPVASAIGGASLVVLVLGRRLRRGPRAAASLVLLRMAPLWVVALASGASLLLDAAAAYGVATVGRVATAWPTLGAGLAPGPAWMELLDSALMIALIGYVASISVAKVLAGRANEKVSADGEMLALGSANIGAALWGGFPVAGSLSRSVAAAEAGARSPLAGVFAAAIVALFAGAASGALASLPYSVLAAIIITSVAPLVDWRTLRNVMAYDRADGATLLATALGVLAGGIERGLVIGTGLALVLYVWRTSRPHITVVGRVPGTDRFRNVHRHAVECVPGIIAIRIDENLYFANVETVEDFVDAQIRAATDTRAVVLVMTAVNSIDASALTQLERLDDRLGLAGIDLHLAEMKGPVLDRLRPTAFATRMAGRIHRSTDAAFEALTPATDRESAPSAGQ